MFKKKNSIFIVLALILVALLAVGVVGCGSSNGDADGNNDNNNDNDNGDETLSMDELVFATGPAGGAWYPVGAALGEIWRRDIGITTHVEQGGGEANIRGVNAKMYDVGFAQGFAAFNAFNAQGVFEGEPHTNIASIANLYPNVQQTVVWADSDIFSIKDLVGKDISPGPLGFAGETIASMMLDFYGLSYDDMGNVENVGYSDAIALMRDRHIDVFWPNTLVPAPIITEAAVMGPGVRIIEVEDDLLAYLGEQGLDPFTVPAGSYRGQDEDVQTVATGTVVIVRADMPDDVAYAIAKSMWENRSELMSISSALEAYNEENVVSGLGVDLHPGAEKYYREIGLVK